MTPAQVIIIDTRRASTSEFKPVQVNRGNFEGHNTKPCIGKMNINYYGSSRYDGLKAAQLRKLTLTGLIITDKQKSMTNRHMHDIHIGNSHRKEITTQRYPKRDHH